MLVREGGREGGRLQCLRMRECSSLEKVEDSGMVKLALTMAKGFSPNGAVKKHTLYRKQPKAYRWGA